MFVPSFHTILRLTGRVLLIMEQILQLDHIDTHEFRMIRCSAKENMGLQEGMEWVVDAIKIKNFLY